MHENIAGNASQLVPASRQTRAAARSSGGHGSATCQSGDKQRNHNARSLDLPRLDNKKKGTPISQTLRSSRIPARAGQWKQSLALHDAIVDSTGGGPLLSSSGVDRLVRFCRDQGGVRGQVAESRRLEASVTEKAWQHRRGSSNMLKQRGSEGADAAS